MQTLGQARPSPQVQTIKVQQGNAQSIAEPLLALLTAADIHADKAIGKVSDDFWNDVDRPASDAAFDLLFPGGNAFYVDGDVTEQPHRMDLLVQLVQANVRRRGSRSDPARN